jgi:hypothetical protein
VGKWRIELPKPPCKSGLKTISGHAYCLVEAEGIEPF